MTCCFYRAGAKYISIEDPSFRFYLNLFDIEAMLSQLAEISARQREKDGA